MFNGPVEIYEDYPIVPEPIHWDSSKNAIEFYVQDFSESVPYVLAHEDFFYLQTNETHQENRKEMLNKRSRTDL